jgi:ATP-binding cassette subfamily F protein 3
MLHINDLVYRIQGRPLFEGATVHIAQGQKVGLIGRNGAGKSTLFRLIWGEIAPDGGSVAVRPRARLGRVAQDMPSGTATPLEIVLAADAERTRLLEAAETAKEAHDIAHVHERLADIGAHGAPARAAAILAGLGFDSQAQARPIQDFSGGWRMRVALAAVLFSEPDLMLLDEPTNHLDLEAALWLETYLAQWPGTLILISHDRDLLNKAADRIVHIDQRRLAAYAGNYDRFERTRREKLDLAAKSYSRQLDQQRKIRAFVERFRAKATKARQAQSRLKMLERMEIAAPIVEEQPIIFEFPDPDQLSPPLVVLEGVEAGYDPARPVLKNLDLRIDSDDRIALLGANGNGKTTLARLLAGRLAPLAGRIIKSPKMKVGYFAQDQADELNLTKSALDELGRLMPLLSEEKRRAHLARFGFGSDKADTRIGNLSGGEKARLLIALMCREAPQLMILDEPTNHLDIDTREALVSAMNAFEGAIVLISHDARLIETAADRLWLVGQGRCLPFEGDLDDYRRLLLEKGRDQRQEKAGGKDSGATTRRDERRAAAEERAKLAPLKKTADAADAKLAKLGEKRRALEAKLADPELYAKHPRKAAELQAEMGQIGKQIEAAEAHWLEAHEALEQARAGLS